MRPPSTITDEDLILHYYGEAAESEAIEAALERSPELARRFAELRGVLDAVVAPEPPARSDLYGHETWRRVRPRLTRRPAPRFARAVPWALAATLLLVLAFWAGRETAPTAPPTVARSELASERILLVAVAEHLERSQFLLLELANSPDEAIDSGRLASVRELKADSRLFRQAAERSGEGEVAFVLESLERFLTELGHVDPAARADLSELAGSLDDTDLLFKVRVLGTRLEERTRGARAQDTDTGPTV